MHRAALAVLVASITAGCTAQSLGLPEYPLGTPAKQRCSLKDCEAKPAAKPASAPANVVSVYTGIAPRILVVGDSVSVRDRDRIARSLFHELNLRGHIKAQGNWQIIGVAEADSVRWRIIDGLGKVIADVDQHGLTDAAVAAIVAGVTSHLRPSEPL